MKRQSGGSSTAPSEAPCNTEAGACTDDAWDNHPALDSLNVPNFHRLVVHGSTFPVEYLRVSVDAQRQHEAGPESFGPFSWERVQP